MVLDDLVGKRVTHKDSNKGIIERVKQSGKNGYVYVRFDNMEESEEPKCFVYPDAFSKYLSFDYEYTSYKADNALSTTNPKLKEILFFDTEVTNETKKLRDIGAISGDGSVLHTTSRSQFVKMASHYEYLCGHNIFKHDLDYIGSDLERSNLAIDYIDTLYLSPLMFPTKPFHHLMKDDKLLSEELNNPVSDSLKARDLFFDELTTFNSLETSVRRIYCSLLYNRKEFHGFFSYLGYKSFKGVSNQIRETFKGLICSSADIQHLIDDYPVELAYCLALIYSREEKTALAPWVSRNYPRVNYIMNLLCNTPCSEGCTFCNAHFDIKSKLKEYFDYDDFRKYEGEPLQERATQAAVDGKSLLAIFPTGGGKSLTFQLPALIAGKAAHGLTVVISPLQSLMKDQVDNLSDKGIVDAVTINGSLNPVERKEAIDLVENGVASILYIAPESLRSASIERLLKSRNIVRFVIDEAHCFSAWGQDFRVDYQYIGPFIKKYQEEKGLENPIPVSCFTATAKRKVISDIREYFRISCGIELELFATNATRTNLRYEVLYREDDEKKYTTLRELILAKNCPTIVYVARTKRAEEIALKLTKDGINAMPYHGKMNPVEKKQNQDAFMSGKVDVIVATTAFGMGIDKDNIGLVVHFNISSSLEDYVQEAGRAGRNPHLKADCFILFNENDLDKHLQYLNQTKLSISEIQQVWRAVKKLSGKRGSFTKTPLEIARAAGWEENVNDVDTKIKAAISALEQAGYLKRGRNVPLIYANGISVHNMTEARLFIEKSKSLSQREKELALRVISFLISRKFISKAVKDEAESRVDYIAERLGETTETIMYIVIRLTEEGILNDSMDMSAHIGIDEKAQRSENTLKKAAALEGYLIDNLPDSGMYSYKEINSAAIAAGIEKATINDLKSIILFWMRQKYIKKNAAGMTKHFLIEKRVDFTQLKKLYEQRVNLSRFIVSYLYKKTPVTTGSTEKAFSILELEKAYNSQINLLAEFQKVKAIDVMNALIYLKAIGALELDGGFLVLYNAMQIDRVEMENKTQYKKDDYKQFADYYAHRVQQIHIVGEYARLMTQNYDEALEFVRDYFTMDYMLFIRKFFKGNEKSINRTITPGKYNKLFDSLSPMQRMIIDDDHSKHIVVAAGPGSGKTKVLVHKLASLLLLEDVRSEQLLMLTFSRAAATEFKQRLIELIGEAAFFVDIKTFHSYAFDVLGKIGNIIESEKVVSKAVEMINTDEADPGKITKTVLVIDEAQDMDADNYALVEALMKINENMRVIAVGDDDQNIYEFRSSDSKYMRNLITEYGAKQYELIENYRSDKCIISLANSFVSKMNARMKSKPIIPVNANTGTAIITKYSTPNLAIPTLELIKNTYKDGSCCVMTVTNDEAMLMTGILNKNGYRAKLIQSNDEFNLTNLIELRTFLSMLGNSADRPLISQAVWDETVEQFKRQYQGSECLQECIGLLNAFDEINKYKYYSDLVEFIKESKLDDYIHESKDQIFVSTVHKSKGREFDSVYMMLNGYRIRSDSERHVVYVGITRARKGLYINCNTDVFSGYSVPGVQFLSDTEKYSEPDEALLQLTHKGVNLGYFKYSENIIKRLHSGVELTESNGDMYIENYSIHKPLLKLSKNAIDQIKSLNDRGYRIYKAKIRYIVYWKGRNEEREVLIALPNIYLKKSSIN